MQRQLSSFDIPRSIPQKHPIPTPMVQEAANRFGPCTTEMILRELDLPIHRSSEMQIAEILKGMGYTRHRIMIKGQRAYVFYPA